MQSARYTCDLNPPLTCTGSVALGSNTLFWWYFALMTYTLVALHTSVSCHTLVSLTVKELCSLVDHCSALVVLCTAGDLLFGKSAQSSMAASQNHPGSRFFPFLIFSLSSQTIAHLLPGFHPGRISEGQFEHPTRNGWMSAQKVENYGFE